MVHRANKGPVDFFYILGRRRINFQEWADRTGIVTKEQFIEWKQALEEAGEYFVSPQASEEGLKLPSRVELKTSEPIAEEIGYSPPVPSPLAEDATIPLETEKVASPKKKKEPRNSTEN